MTQQASETMHPTDDELEAMALKLAPYGLLKPAATMLRACKGGAVKVNKDSQSKQGGVE